MSKVVDDISHKEIDAPFRVCFVINKNQKSMDEKDKLGRNKQRYIDEISMKFAMYILPKYNQNLLGSKQY